MVPCFAGTFPVFSQEADTAFQFIPEVLSAEEINLILELYERNLSPVRDIPDGYKAFENYRVEGGESMLESEEYARCRGHCQSLFMYCNEADAPVYFPDPFGNEVSFFGFYGEDERQRYYVYEPESGSNGEVVVLIHGGGWFSGPNPEEVIGFPFKFAPQATDSSLVGDLLEEGYTVVSVLYRLTKYGSTQQEIESNLVNGENAMDRILDDVEDAVNHFKDSMYACYEMSYTDFHIVGESAGGHIALMYAYTRADTGLVKSVTSMYAPSNYRQFATYVKTVGLQHTCGNQYIPGVTNDFFRESICNYNVINFAIPYHSPFYWLIDTTLTFWTQNFFDNQCSTNVAHQRVLLGYDMFQSAMGKLIPTPSSSADLLDYSPALLADSIYPINAPTFIMHGLRDIVVPHNQSRNNMNTRLDNNGGLLSQNSVCHDTAMPALGQNETHIERLYRNLGHGFTVIISGANQSAEFQSNMFKRVREDIIHWINLY